MLLSAPGKLVLMGEYAVVNGSPAIVASVPYRASLYATPSTDDFRFTGTPVGGSCGPYRKVSELNEKEPTQQMIAAAFRAGHKSDVLPLPNFHVTLDTLQLYANDGGRKRGYGSSGVALLLLTAFFMRDESDTGTEGWLHRVVGAARRAQQQLSLEPGSGIDLVGGTFGGIRRFDPNDWRGDGLAESPESFVAPRAVALLEIAHARNQSTQAALGLVRVFATSQPNAYADLMTDMEACETLTEATLRNDSAALPELFDHYGVLMEELGKRAGVSIVTDELRRAREVLRVHGGGVKPSGAGGGDTSVAAVPLESVDFALADLRAADLDARRLEIDPIGLSYEA